MYVNAKEDFARTSKVELKIDGWMDGWMDVHV